MEKPFLIGLTGQTGAGKAYVGQYLKELGYNIADADYYSKIVIENREILEKLAAAFGSDIIKNGAADRQLLAKRAFSSAENTATLNAIMHPAVLNAAVKGAAFPCVFDAPLLFECGGDRLCEITVCVTADEKTRLSRIMQRDKISAAQAKLRMQAQHSEEFYLKKSDCVVINDGRNIKIQIDNILEERL
ncbi:MAG: dephospho-CoA kinase [Clostridiales bacterium]|nr:dephospho-CoA kinase [Clostridiales bacterium]